MRWIRVLIAAFAIVLLETTVLSAIAVEGIRPDLAFIFVFFLALNTVPEEGFPAFWLVGLMKDAFSAGTFGAYALLYSACGYQASAMTQGLFRDNPLIQIAVAAPAAAAVNVLYCAGVIFASPHVSPAALAAPVLVCVIYTLVLTPPLLYIMGKMKSLLGIRPRRPPYTPEGAAETS